MFSHLCVFLLIGGCWFPSMDHRSHEQGRLHPGRIYIQGVLHPREGVCLQGVCIWGLVDRPPRSAYGGVGQSPPPEIHGILWDTVNKRTVRILLFRVYVISSFEMSSRIWCVSGFYVTSHFYVNCGFGCYFQCYDVTPVFFWKSARFSKSNWKTTFSTFWISCSYSVLDGETETYATVSYTPNQWFHAVMIYHGPQGFITVYHDATEVGTPSRYPRATTSGTGQMLIGARDIEEVSPYYSSVAVDEVKMWNRQISEDEISNMYP